MQNEPAHCVPRPKRANHQLDVVIPRGRGPLSPTHRNIATGCFPCLQARDSILLPLYAALRSPLKRSEPNYIGKLDGKRGGICTSFPSGGTDPRPILEGVRLPRGL